MIKRIYSLPEVSDTYYGKKIRSYYEAYGAEYDFCRFYASDNGGVMLLYNSTMTIDGEFEQSELEGFVEMLDLCTIEVSKDMHLQLGEDMQKLHRTLFKLVPKENNVDKKLVNVNTLHKEAFEIISDGFGVTEFDLWYVDIFRRINKGSAELYLYKNTTVTRAFEVDGFAFYSHIATASAERGKGTARNLLYYLCVEAEKRGSEAFLFAKDERKSFYEEAGFIPVGYDYIYEKDI